ncbi:MAG: DNA primase DnaG [Nanoarchaeota archaeon]|nr:DNA primase DnaG [Nanoarchaeota archaeon]
MAKVSPVSIKYMITASFRAEGPLEKPDVIGAIFGQTEGLLGSDLEMRELQKEGKIGRIEVNLDIVDGGKSVGEIFLPSALDKSETTIIAAALETIERIGPTEAKIEVTKIDDVRASKRDFIVDRAKKLLEGMDSGSAGFGEMSKTVTEEARAARMQEYGEEKLPAGDLTGNEIIVVEGRADVVNMLKNRVNNVIGMNGTKLPKEIAILGEKKELTLFIDGDRGGKLIAGNVMNHAKIFYVAVAPDGKEVEELTGKEILLCLRKKVPADQFVNILARSVTNGNDPYDLKNNKSKEIESKSVEQIFAGDAKELIKKVYASIKSSKDAVILDSNGDAIRKVSNKEVTRTILGSRNQIFAVVIDGPATGPTIRACDEMNISYCAATSFGSVTGSEKVKLISL